MNKLLEELKEKREYHVARVKGLTEDIAVAQRMIVDEEEAIADLDKAIAALSTEPEEGLLDDNQLKTAPVQSASEQDKADHDDDWEDACGDLNCAICHGTAPGVSDYSRGAQDAIDGEPRAANETDEYYIGYDATIESVGPIDTDAERISDESQAELVIEQTEESDLPALTDQQYQALPKFEDEGTPVLDAEPTSIPRSEIPEGAAVETRNVLIDDTADPNPLEALVVSGRIDQANAAMAITQREVDEEAEATFWAKHLTKKLVQVT